MQMVLNSASSALAANALGPIATQPLYPTLGYNVPQGPHTIYM